MFAGGSAGGSVYWRAPNAPQLAQLATLGGTLRRQLANSAAGAEPRPGRAASGVLGQQPRAHKGQAWAACARSHVGRASGRASAACARSGAARAARWRRGRDVK